MKVLESENPRRRQTTEFPTPLDSKIDLDLLYEKFPEIRLSFAVCSVCGYFAARERIGENRPFSGFPHLT
jgi:hypothetical protein